MKKKLFVVIPIVLIIFITTILILKLSNKNEKIDIYKGPTEDELSKRLEWMKEADNNNIHTIISNIFHSETIWNDDKYPISRHFKQKYKHRSDVNAKFKNNDRIEETIVLSNRQIFTIFYDLIKYYYKYYINEYGELDDIEYIREVEYIKIKDELGFDDYIRADGKIEVTDPWSFINFFTYPGTMTDSGFNFEGDISEFYTSLSNDYELINKPKLEEIGTPKNAYWMEYNSEEGDIEVMYLKDGNPYLIIEFYEGFIKKYEIRYHINDDNLFDYIEWIDVP